MNVQVEIPSEFVQCLKGQRAHFEANRFPDHAQRVADLKALVRLVADNRESLVAAVNRDYGCRARFETTFAEIAVTLDGLQVAIKQLKKWMKPQKRHTDTGQTSNELLSRTRNEIRALESEGRIPGLQATLGDNLAEPPLPASSGNPRPVALLRTYV